jgi:hypothetical protein
MLRHARDREEEAVSAWLLLLGMLEAAPALYEASKRADWSAPLDYAMCPR